jgi:hypothetical protein
MKRVALILLALALALVVAIVRMLPPPARALEPMASIAPSVRGVVHIHTRRSDGTGTAGDVAAAAARAGLKFVILTDHDDASREPEPPAYRNGVLVIDASEISTDNGHVVALGLPKAPYPLAGEARDVLEDIRRLGGFSIAAHPGSEKPDLRWTEWTAPFDGLEWLNGDSEWRDEQPRARALMEALLTYPFRRPETLAGLLDRPDAVLRRWDALTQRRRVVGLAAADVHARIGLRSGEPTDSSIALHLPGYEPVFRTMSVTVSPVTLTGDAAVDANSVMSAIRAGHVYSSIDALAAPAAFSFVALAGGKTSTAGDAVPIGAGAVDLQVASNAPADAEIVMLKNGERIATATGKSLTRRVAAEPGVYRTEVHLPGAPGDPPVPWIVSNPIYIGTAIETPTVSRAPATAFASQYADGPATGWTIETSPRSMAALDVVPTVGGGTQLALRWALGGTLSENPYAALVMAAGPAIGAYDRVMFNVRASRPMRLSIQVRIPGDGGGERWQRSIYLDENPRDITVFVDDMTPRGETTRRRPVLSTVRDLLFVIDTVNTKPGTAGQIWIDDVKYGR